MKFKPLDRKDIDFLKKTCGENAVFTGEEINEDFHRDELAGVKNPPEALVMVTETEQVSRIMKYASEKCISVTPRGQGTGLVGGGVALTGGIMICFTKMNRILELDRENLTLTVEPGVMLMEISSYVEEQGLFYPPDPGEKSATIGGNISTNAGGMRAVKYGVTRDYVRGLEVVLPDGTVLELGGKVVKNSSGFSIRDLIIGSEGTLGIVTKAVLKLLPLPQKKLSLLIPFPTLEKAIETVPKIICARMIPTAVEYMVRDVIIASEKFLGKIFPDKSADAYLLLTFDGNSLAEIEKIADQASEICLKEGAVDVFISNTPEREESIWSARGAFLEAIKASTSEMDECDVVVPRNRIADFVKYANGLQPELGLRIRSFGHAGDGNLHIYMLRDDLPETEWKNRLSLAFDLLYSKAEEMGGEVSGEHGIGFSKVPYLEKSLGPAGMALLKKVKQAFDPGGILNPGKVCG